MKVSKPYLEHCFTPRGAKNLDCGYSAVQFMLIIVEIIRSCAITNYITKHPAQAPHHQEMFCSDTAVLRLAWPGLVWSGQQRPNTPTNNISNQPATIATEAAGKENCMEFCTEFCISGGRGVGFLMNLKCNLKITNIWKIPYQSFMRLSFLRG